jgi:serine/threonine protein kinase
MGQVFRPATACRSARSDQDARSPYAQKPTLVARFTQEAPAAASLSHPIVAVFDSGSEAGLHYLVMEYVEAQSAAAAPTSRCRWSTTRPAARPASWSTSSPRTHPDKQVPRAVDGFRQVVSGGGLVGG